MYWKVTLDRYKYIYIYTHVFYIIYSIYIYKYSDLCMSQSPLFKFLHDY